MKVICKTILIFLFACSINSFSASAMTLNYPLTKLASKTLTDITVGHRSTDSTGRLDISTSTIQQSIIPLITSLNKSTITSGTASLLVFQNMAYLLFAVTDTAGVKASIAIQLNESTSGDFIFHPEIGNELHILSNSENCSICMYIKKQGAIAVTDCPSSSPCKHRIHFSF